MTKEQFKLLDLNMKTYCKCCKKYKPITCFAYRDISSHGQYGTRCKVCDWFKRNYNSQIPSINGFTNNDIVKTIEFIIDEKGFYINDLAKMINHPINETIVLLHQLNLNNVHMQFRTQCVYCKKIIEKPLNVYEKNKDLYCSLDCYWNDKHNKVGIGEDNPSYSRIKTTCTNCGKNISVINYDYNKTNKFGDNHNFCSQQCYWNYRTKYYVKEKAALYNYIYTDEQKQLSRERYLKQIKSSNRLNTKIQLKINNILDKLHVDFEREKTFDYYSVDNYLPSVNGIIEVMGDYWHGSPVKYNENKYLLSELQQKQIHRDKLKYSYIKNHYNINILYLWEYNIDNNIDLCEKLIQLYIINNTELKNYHSFNWSLINNSICLNKKLIIPYQNMTIENYRHLIKNKVV